MQRAARLACFQEWPSPVCNPCSDRCRMWSHRLKTSCHGAIIDEDIHSCISPLGAPPLALRQDMERKAGVGKSNVLRCIAQQLQCSAKLVKILGVKALIEDTERYLIQRSESPEKEIQIGTLIRELVSKIEEPLQGLFVMRRLPYRAQRRPLLGRRKGLI